MAVMISTRYFRNYSFIQMLRWRILRDGLVGNLIICYAGIVRIFVFLMVLELQNFMVGSYRRLLSQ